LEAVVRVYWYVTYEGKQKKDVAKIEYWDSEGIHRYVYEDEVLLPDVEYGAFDTHFVIVNPEGEEMRFNWTRPPFICFKYNHEEQPLLKQIKTLIDDYDKKKSENSNVLEENPDSDILVLKNYDGTDLGDFRRNLSTFRAIKVSDDGGVDTIKSEVNSEAYKVHSDQNRKDIYEFGRGVDTQSEKLGSDVSGIALKFLYADLDMDCNMIETEFQWALKQLIWFINVHLANSGQGDFFNEKVTFLFNRDVPINETEAVKNAKDSVGIISDETIVANHPWTTNVQEEMDRIEEQRKKDMEEFGSPGSLDANASAGNETVPGADPE
jgi:SPP1 family phage portal protein